MCSHVPFIVVFLVEFFVTYLTNLVLLVTFHVDLQVRWVVKLMVTYSTFSFLAFGFWMFAGHVSGQIRSSLANVTTQFTLNFSGEAPFDVSLVIILLSKALTTHLTNM